MSSFERRIGGDAHSLDRDECKRIEIDKRRAFLIDTG
jgi:hypothetical protein